MRRNFAATVCSAIVITAVLGAYRPVEAQELRSYCFGKGPQQEPPIDLFLAMKQGLIDARVVVRDPYHGKIVLQNVSAMPLAIQLPQFAAARPILAQFQFPGLTGQQGPGSSTIGSQSGLPQAVGGPMSSSSSQNIFQGSGPFNIAPEQVRTVDLNCFCLEHGKPNPRSAVKYELVPLAEANDDPRLPGLFAAFAQGDVERETAQAAVWHAANDLDWKALAGLSQKISLNARRPLFNARQLERARSLVADAAKRSAGEMKVAARKSPPVVERPTTSASPPTKNAMPTKQAGRREQDRI